VQVHNWDKLQEETKAQENDDETKKQAREDLTKLLESVTSSPELEKYFKSRDSNIKAGISTFDTMWTLFAPKTKIVAKLFLNQTQILEVGRAPIPRRRTRRNPEAREHTVLAWCWDWNGKKMVKVYYFLPIERYWGTKDIDQLFCYPLQYHNDDKEELCKSIIARGERYNAIVRSEAGATQMYKYDGPALSERRSVIRKKRESVRRMTL
jgi:hypothetical protein